jgi:hypothetical protein
VADNDPPSLETPYLAQWLLLDLHKCLQVFVFAKFFLEQPCKVSTKNPNTSFDFSDLNLAQIGCFLKNNIKNNYLTPFCLR